MTSETPSRSSPQTSPWWQILLTMVVAAAALPLVALLSTLAVAAFRLPIVLSEAADHPGKLFPISASEGDRVWVGALVLALVVSVVVPVTLRSLQIRDSSAFIGLTAPRRTELAKWLAAGVLVEFLMIASVNALDLGEGSAAARHALSTATNRVLLVSSLVVLAPLAEEILFRGLLLGPVAHRSSLAWPSVTAIALSSLLWASAHERSPLGTVLLAMQGAVFAVARLKSGSIVTPWLMHLVKNSYSVAVLLAGH